MSRVPDIARYIYSAIVIISCFFSVFFQAWLIYMVLSDDCRPGGFYDTIVLLNAIYVVVLVGHVVKICRAEGERELQSRNQMINNPPSETDTISNPGSETETAQIIHV